MDEVGYLQFDPTQASLLFQVVCQRYQREQVVCLTSNKAFADWGHVFADDASRSDQSYVWTIDEASSTVQRQPVEMVSFSERGALVRGLEAGNRIVIAGVHSLREGQTVRIDD